jgi:hypothetical protein
MFVLRSRGWLGDGSSGGDLAYQFPEGNELLSSFRVQALTASHAANLTRVCRRDARLCHRLGSLCYVTAVFERTNTALLRVRDEVQEFACWSTEFLRWCFSQGLRNVEAA